MVTIDLQLRHDLPFFLPENVALSEFILGRIHRR